MKASSSSVEPSDPHAEAPARMSRLQFWSVLALAFTLFLFEAGPIWRHPWDMDLLNRAIFWSYVAIPLLVIACLAWSKRLSLRVFFVDTLVLTLVKYSCTFAFALILWEVTPFPVQAHTAALPHAARIAAVEPAPAPTLIDPAKTGTVGGTVVDAAGHPVANALVWISGGLEEYVFAPPSVPVALATSETGTTPALAVVQANQPILARSADGRLHTMIAVKDGKTLFNTPLLPSGDASRVSFRNAEGLVAVHCNVHAGSTEAGGQVLVLGNPFFAWTDARGRFALRGIPAGRLQLTSDAAGQPGREQAIDLAAGENVEVTLAAAATLASVRSSQTMDPSR